MYSKLIRFSNPRGVLNLVDHNWKTTQSHQYYAQKEVDYDVSQKWICIHGFTMLPNFFPSARSTFSNIPGDKFFLLFFFGDISCNIGLCSIAKKHLQGQFWFSMSPRWRFCLSDVSVCTSWIITKVACTELCVGCFQLPLMHHITTHTPSLEHSHHFVFFCVADANRKKRFSHSRLPPRFKKPVANCKYLWFSIRRIGIVFFDPWVYWPGFFC